MNPIRTLIHASLYPPYWYQKLRKTGPFGNQKASYLDTLPASDSHPLKKALFHNFVRQYHEAACSVASVVTVINALRSGEEHRIPPITQLDILDRVNVGHWKERMSDKGYNGRRGVPLPLLGEMVEASLAAFAIHHTGVETVHASANPDSAGLMKSTLRDRLNGFEKQGNGLIIAHFNQGRYVPTLGIPHISPVGGFDSRKREVTLLDVDLSELGGPYRISFETFYQGLISTYNPFLRHLGYKNGGYVFIRLS